MVFRSGDKNKLQLLIMKNKAARIMCFKSKYDAINPAYEKLKILSLRHTLTFTNCQCVQDQINGNLPISFIGYFNRIRNQQNRAFNENDNLRV